VCGEVLRNAVMDRVVPVGLDEVAQVSLAGVPDGTVAVEVQRAAVVVGCPVLHRVCDHDLFGGGELRQAAG
jgi:hypothetical protein